MACAPCSGTSSRFRPIATDSGRSRLEVPLHGAKAIRVEMSLGVLGIGHVGRVIRLCKSLVVEVHRRRSVGEVVSRAGPGGLAPRKRATLGVREAVVIVG